MKKHWPRWIFAGLAIIVFLVIGWMGIFWVLWDHGPGMSARFRRGGCYVGLSIGVSPDGKSIAFGTPTGNSDIMGLDLETGQRTYLLNSDDYEGFPDYRADGSLLYTYGKTSQCQLYVLPSGQSQPRQLLSSVHSDYLPSADASGKRIAFTRLIQGVPPRGTQIFLLDGDGERQLTLGFPRATWPMIRPDGKQVAFHNKDGLMLIDADGTNERVMLDGFPGGWSSDSRWLLFLDDPDVKFQYDIYRVEVETGQVERLTHDGIYKSSPRFCLGDTHVVYAEDTCRAAGHIILLELKTGQRRKLAPLWDQGFADDVSR